MADPPRIGLGTDLHRLELGRPCILGGVRIDSPVGPVAHSDGDAVLHALADALLGAGGLEDLGVLFPDDDPRWRGASSELFIDEAMRLLTEKGLTPCSVDIVLHCERPRIGPHRAAMRKRIAALIDLPTDRVNVKGKSRENSGGEETISVTAVVLVGPKQG